MVNLGRACSKLHAEQLRLHEEIDLQLIKTCLFINMVIMAPLELHSL